MQAPEGSTRLGRWKMKEKWWEAEEEEKQCPKTKMKKREKGCRSTVGIRMPLTLVEDIHARKGHKDWN
ncbi:uncharacterized protein G2W53_022881 [Senna tora]|uniref:Uncharacterized protein n=1 Tax=Senna tora TaxID=362788 RepID=A0A834WJ54_9FABA|nr:uncharacterized protein G2W53_022881 [Senna tora]